MDDIQPIQNLQNLQNQDITLDTKLNRNWNLWYHYDKDNWKVDGFKNIYTIETINDFWQLYNVWIKNGSVSQKHFFLMSQSITPIWEDPVNRKGGCWSFKIQESQALDLWTDLSVYLVTENMSSSSNDITGISICLKKNNSCVIKVWNKNSKNNSLLLLNENILKKWGMDIIYIAHIPD